MRNESVMKWNEKERKRKESESYPGMIGNDCENDRKRLQYLPSVLPLRGMDSSEIPLFSVHFPRFSVHIPQKISPVRKAPRGMVILYRLLYLSLGILVVFC